MDWKPWDGVFNAHQWGGNPIWDSKNPIVAFRNDKMDEYPVQYSKIPVNWFHVHDFVSDMEFERLEQGRSSFRVRLRAEDGIIYPAFLGDLEILLRTAVWKDGVVSSPKTWTFVKRGANYGIALKERVDK